MTEDDVSLNQDTLDAMERLRTAPATSAQFRGKQKGELLPLNEVRKNLCWHDPHHPDYPDLQLALEEDIPAPRGNCGCDNCFYGRDRLAVEILGLRGER